MENQTLDQGVPVPQPSQPWQPQQKAVMPSAFTILKQAIAFYRSNLALVLAVASVPFILSVLSLFTDQKTTPGLFATITLVSAISSFLAYVAMLHAVAHNGRPQEGAMSAYTAALTSILPFVLVMLLTFFTVWGGIVLFIIPGIYLSVLLSMSAMIFVAENKRGMSALVQSWHYVRGYWWAVVGKMIFLMLVMMAVMIGLTILAFIIGFFYGVSGLIDVQAYATEIALVGGVINNALNNFVFFPINLIYLFFIYQSLRGIKTEVLAPEEGKKIRNKILIFVVLGILGAVAFGGIIWAAVTSTSPNIERAQMSASSFLSTAGLSSVSDFFLSNE